MTDKEIIIDGVDITGCEFHSSTPSSELCYMKGNKCKDNPNCYYKQLKRKEQECEKLKNENFAFENLIKDYEKYGAIEEIIQKLDRYKQALEKIEESAKNICKNCGNKDTKWCNSDCDIFNELSIINEVKE